ncbi:MAG: light-harvesting antenna LH1, beta subunit [Methylocystis sp.]|jgi:light-harvesting complex 1 beta chain
MAIDKERSSLSGLTEAEAIEFHSLFVKSFLIFTFIAIIAHVLVWFWRPWLPGPKGYALLDGVTNVAHAALSLLG